MIIASVFLVWLLPAFVALYYLVVASLRTSARHASWSAPVATALIAGLTVVILARSNVGWILLGDVAFTLIAADLISRRHGEFRSACVAVAVLLNVGVLIYTWVVVPRAAFVHLGVTVITCHAIALIIDLRKPGDDARRETSLRRSSGALYLLQFPVLPAGPILRYQEIVRQQPRLPDALSIGAFTYGTRRIVMGLLKVFAIAEVLREPVDAIFALPSSRLAMDTAWFGALCFSLQLYFQFSGYADIAVGMGKMLGLRYPDNFRRPYVADSVREFWRRWNVTAIMWLRDYLSLPIMGRDRPTPRLLPEFVIAFVLLGVWHGAGRTVLLWAVYASACLALESLWLGRHIERWRAPARHLYVLVIVMVGWVILRAESMEQAVVFLKAMAGFGEGKLWLVERYLTLSVMSAIVVGLIGAGPLVPGVSRWRVSLDAMMASIVMMVAAVSVFVWSLVPWRRRESPR